MTAAAITGSAAALRLVRAHIWRAALLWVAAHVFLALAVGELATLSARTSAFAALTASIVSVFDARRRRELGFLANLGVPWTVPFTIAASTVLVLELLLVGARGVFL